MNGPGFDPSDIAHTIQLAVAPVFLLAGIAGILNMLTGRLARIVDRARNLTSELHGSMDHEDAQAHRAWELPLLDRRMAVVNWAIFSCTASALAICLVVAGLFVAVLGGFGLARVVAVVFILAMMLLILALLLFLVEVRLARRTVRVEEGLLTRRP